MIEATVIPPGKGPSNGLGAFDENVSVMNTKSVGKVNPGTGNSNKTANVLP